MAWDDDLRPASFRGIPFVVEDAEREGGRRIHVHELLSRPISQTRRDPFVEDLGPGTRRHAIDAYVVGDDVLARRDSLLAALETAGTGVLIHPYLGSLLVAVETFRLRHSTREGRIARFGIVFVETDEPESSARPAPREDARRSSDALAAAAVEDWTARTDVVGVPDWTLESAISEYQSTLDRLRSIDLSAGPIGDAAELVRAIDAIGDGLVDIATGFGYPAALQDAVDSVAEAIGSKTAALEAYLGLEEFRGSSTGSLSATGRIADENALANEELLRALALAAAVRAAIDIAWSSLEDALAARDRISERLDGLADQVGDATYLLVVDLRARLAAALPPEDEALPRIQTVQLERPTSAILLAYRVFRDASRESEIVGRNRPAWPGILPVADPLEILVDAS